MSGKPVFIADGHHRYETALKYQEELSRTGAPVPHDDPSNFCLMMLVGMSDPGLLILPTHRLISGFPGLTADELKTRLEPEFEISDAGTGESQVVAPPGRKSTSRASKTCSHSGRSPTAAG